MRRDIVLRTSRETRNRPSHAMTPAKPHMGVNIQGMGGVVREVRNARREEGEPQRTQRAQRQTQRGARGSVSKAKLAVGGVRAFVPAAGAEDDLAEAGGFAGQEQLLLEAGEEQ